MDLQQHGREPARGEHRLGLRLHVRPRGYDIAQKPIEFTPDDTHGRAFLVSLLNTVIVAVLGIIARRCSASWRAWRAVAELALSKVAMVYVETFRNIPLLLQLLFWYKAVLSLLPGPARASCCRSPPTSPTAA